MKRLGWLITIWAFFVLVGALVPYVFAHESFWQRIAWLIMLGCTLVGAVALTKAHIALERAGRGQRDE